MSFQNKEIYDFANFRLDVAERKLLRNARAVQLTDKAFDTLCVLVRRHGELISKDELMEAVWPDAVVEENNLDQKVSILRKVLGEKGRGKEKFIETVRGRGYRFLPEVTRVREREISPNPEGRVNQVTQARSSGSQAPAVYTQRTGNVVAVAKWQLKESETVEKPDLASGPQPDSSHIELVPTASANSRRLYTLRRWPIPVVLVLLVLGGLVYWRWFSPSRSTPADVAAIESAAAIESVAANPEANRLYLQGLYHWNKRTAEDVRKSIDLFSQALDKDPSYAKAHAGLAMAFLILPDYDHGLSREEFHQINLKLRAAVRSARELDDTLPEVHALAATIKEDEWDFAGAEKDYQRAIELDPNWSSAYHWYSRLLGALGRNEEAIEKINKARELDPFSRSIAFNVGARLADARRFDEAIEQYKRVLEMEPDHALTHLVLAAAYDAKGMFGDAIPEYKRAWVLLEKESDESAERKVRELTETLKTDGAAGYWQKRLEFSQQDYAKGTGKAYMIAVCFARLGDQRSTFEQLERSLAARELDLIWIRSESAFDAMSGDPRFADLLRRIGVG